MYGKIKTKKIKKMEQYSLPQFIEQEGKITFFLSYSQFFYLAGAGVICYILYYLVPQNIFYILAAIICIVAVALAFVKIEGAPLSSVILHSLGFSVKGKNYVWKKKEVPYPFKPIERIQMKKIEEKPTPSLQKTHLKKVQLKIETRS